MTAFDTDILSDIGKDVPSVVARAVAVPVDQQCVPVVAVEEVFRGQLSAIRAAQAAGGQPLEVAYGYFEESLAAVRQFRVLSYTSAADSLFLGWRRAKVRIGTRDLRIAAICVVHGATLVTRNARDYAQVPGLTYSVWN
jgi:tRNA(fMet)-specific endonuclease VapC